MTSVKLEASNAIDDYRPPTREGLDLSAQLAHSVAEILEAR